MASEQGNGIEEVLDISWRGEMMERDKAERDLEALFILPEGAHLAGQTWAERRS